MRTGRCLTDPATMPPTVDVFAAMRAEDLVAPASSPTRIVACAGCAGATPPHPDCSECGGCGFQVVAR